MSDKPSADSVPDDKPREPRKLGFSLKSMFIAISVLSVFIAVPVGLLRFVVRTVEDAYLVQNAGYVLVDYMKRHDGAWPQDWDDLQAFVSAGGSGTSISSTLKRSAVGRMLTSRSIRSQSIRMSTSMTRALLFARLGYATVGQRVGKVKVPTRSYFATSNVERMARPRAA